MLDSLKQPTILVVDDDPDILSLVQRLLENSRCTVKLAECTADAWTLIEEERPDLIFLDVQMPGENAYGYAFCAKMQKNTDLARIPVVFLSVLGGEADKARAFAVGAVDYLSKPPRRSALEEALQKHLFDKTEILAEERRVSGPSERFSSDKFTAFKVFVSDRLSLSPEKCDLLADVGSGSLYEMTSDLGVNSGQMARLLAEFLHLNYVPFIDPKEIQLGVISTDFCNQNKIVPVKGESSKNMFIVSNPFDAEVLDEITQKTARNGAPKLMITEPINIVLLMKYIDALSLSEEEVLQYGDVSHQGFEDHPVSELAECLLSKAVSERASDIYLQWRYENMMIRFRIDGDFTPVYTLNHEVGILLSSRFKGMGARIISKVQAPRGEDVISDWVEKSFKLQVTPIKNENGEHLLIRLFEQNEVLPSLLKLGMSEDQEEHLKTLAERSRGLLLFVGARQSGQSTSIRSFFSGMENKLRRLVTLETFVRSPIPEAAVQIDPGEHETKDMNILLGEALAQKPDILFLGKLDQCFSARAVLEFSKKGHLTVSRLHTTNTTSALMSLKKLGVSRALMADGLMAVIAQKLIRKLCSACKVLEKISEKERKLLSPFMTDLPQKVAHARGCSLCRGTGYYGREAVYHILEIDRALKELFRTDISFSEIMSFCRKRRKHSMADQALEKMSHLVFSPMDVFEKVLIEEIGFEKMSGEDKAPLKAKPSREKRILLVDDDPDIRHLISRVLSKRAYKITTANDGIEALLCLGKQTFDLIISDINMPNLDGFKLLEMNLLKGIEIPVIFVSGRMDEESEINGLALGAAAYLKKPIDKNILIQNVADLLEPTLQKTA